MILSYLLYKTTSLTDSIRNFFCTFTCQVSQLIVKMLFSSDKRVKQSFPTPPRTVSSKSVTDSLSPGSPNCEIASLSFKDIAQKNRHSPRRLTVDTLSDYLLDVVGTVYSQDRLGVVSMILRLVDEEMKKLKSKIQQRLSLLGYMTEGLKFKGFAQIDHDLQSQWRKNHLFRVISSLWCFAMGQGKITTVNDFVEEYTKHRKLVASLTYFYFKDCWEVLESRKQPVYQLIFNDTAHHIIMGCKDWPQVYKEVFLPLFPEKHYMQDEVNFEYDLSKLKMNSTLLNLDERINPLPLTTQAISQFAEATSLKSKIEILKEMRKHFLAEINQNRVRLAGGKAKECALQKDDIIDCMIYCIIKGQITALPRSLEALIALLGRNSDLLGRKGVDSYRTDLQSAIMFLSENPLCSALVSMNGTQMNKE